MQKFPLFLGLSATILTLGACKSFMNPTFMPAGYAHHSDNYKAPDGPEAWDIGYDYTRAENAAVLNRWKMVAADLTDKIEQGAPLDAAPVFLSSPTIDNAFTLSLDHALREEFRTRGYTLASIPSEETTKLQVSAYDPQFRDTMRSYDLNDQPQKDLPEEPEAISKELVLKVDGLVGEEHITLVERAYVLPLYGYQDEQLYFPLSQNIAEVWR